MATISHEFRAVSPRRLVDPSTPQNQEHVMYVPFEDLPEGVSDDLNLRTTEDLDKEPSKGSVYAQLIASIGQELGTALYFKFRNKGIHIVASSFAPHPDREKDMYVLTYDSEFGGIFDGGHTYQSILRHRVKDDGSFVDEKVKLHIYTGFVVGNEKHEDIVHEVATGQNTTVQVKTQSIADHANAYAFMKERPYSDHIKYTENEQHKYLDVQDVIGTLTCFDITEYPLQSVGAKHPMIAATGRKVLLDRFVKAFDNSKEDKSFFNPYQAMADISGDILRLRNLIAKDGPKVHNKIGGKAGAINYIQTPKNHKNVKRWFPFPFLETEDASEGDRENEDGVIISKDQLYKGVLYPILAGFRCMIERKPDGTFGWDRDFTEVIGIWEQVKPAVMAHIRDRGAEVGNKPDNIAKTAGLWHTILLSFVIASGTVNKLS